MKNITWLSDSFNNNYGNFSSIWSNAVSNSPQDNALVESQYLFHIFKLKFATMTGQTLNIRKKLKFVKFNSSNVVAYFP